MGILVLQVTEYQFQEIPRTTPINAKYDLDQIKTNANDHFAETCIYTESRYPNGKIPLWHDDSSSLTGLVAHSWAMDTESDERVIYEIYLLGEE